MRSLGRNLAWLAAIAGAIGLLLHLFVLEAWEVPPVGGLFDLAIQPAIQSGDRLLVRRKSEPRFGQLARCVRPDGSGYAVGRVFGQAGDHVQIRDERVIVNGRGIPSRFACGTMVLPHPVSGRATALQCSAEDGGTSTYEVLLSPDMREGERSARVSAGRLYLVSDNRHFHLDSRDFGEVEASTCEPIVFRLWGERFTVASRRFNILW